MKSLSKESVRQVFDMIRGLVSDQPIDLKKLERKIIKEINDEEKRDSKERAKQYYFFV